MQKEACSPAGVYMNKNSELNELFAVLDLSGGRAGVVGRLVIALLLRT